MILKKILPKTLSSVVALGLFLLFTATAQGEGCFSIVVGKNASVDGYVIMAHNEDDGPPQIVHHHKVPRMKHSPDEKVELLNGGEVAQIEETWAYIWSEMPGMLFSDSYINEWGVCIASDACPSKEDYPELTDGGISLMLRRLLAQRAKSAREGVQLAGALVERFGYDSSGRTYVISDPDEGWLFCAIHGKRWLAQRVPDDEVAIIANTYSVHEVNLSDEDHFLASESLIDYAVSRGWYNPDEKQPFDFAAAFADPEAALDSSNFCRQWSGLRHIAADAIPLDGDLPFSVVPKQKLDVAAVQEILRDHYEGTKLYRQSQETGTPHETSLNTICNNTTQTSFVAQLRKDMPLDIGIVYWVCLSVPCASCYIPFHFGISNFPMGYATDSTEPSDELYQRRVEATFRSDSVHAFWIFSNFHHKIEGEYADKIKEVTIEFDAIEKVALSKQQQIERAALQLYPIEKATALRMLTNYSLEIYLSALEAMARVMEER
jgi:dipeptidase